MLSLGFERGEADDSARFIVCYTESTGKAFTIRVEMIFESAWSIVFYLTQDIFSYPSSYDLLLFTEEDSPPRAEITFARFLSIFDQTISEVIPKIVRSLQGDDEATGGSAPDVEYEEQVDEDWTGPGRGFEVAKGSIGDLGKNWTTLKESVYSETVIDCRYFAQGKSMGYRPGLTRVSDFWVTCGQS